MGQPAIRETDGAALTQRGAAARPTCRSGHRRPWSRTEAGVDNPDAGRCGPLDVVMSILADGDGELRTVVLREPHLVLEAGRDDSVTDGRGHAEVVHLEQRWRQCDASVVTLAPVLIHVNSHGATHYT